MPHPNATYSFDIHSPFSFLQMGTSDTVSGSLNHKTEKPGEYCLLLQTDHTMKLHVEHLVLTLSPGEYLLLPAAVWNQKRLPELTQSRWKQESCGFCWLCFSVSQTLPSDLGSANKNQPNPIVLPSHGSLLRPQKVLLLIRQLQDCIHSGYEKHYLDYLTTLMICEIFHQQCLINGKKTSLRDLSDARKQLYFDLLDYISSHITCNLKVNAIARHFGYNEKYLSRYFRELSGISLKQYITNQKIEYANFLLADTDRTINEISQALGFSDYHNFIRVYKSVTAMTPTEYRHIYL